jgi:hypothetical protein
MNRARRRDIWPFGPAGWKCAARTEEKDPLMTQLVEPTPLEESGATDLVAAVHRVLAASAEPLTLSKIRALLPARLRPESLEELAACLNRQVAANVLYQYPKYRSQQDRFWDRSMPVHVASLLRAVLAEGPLAWFELRRKLPAYALPHAQEVLQAQVSQGLLFQHPPAGKRGGDRYGVRPADPKDYLRSELAQVFQRLEQLGFRQAQVRASALELLHEEEWVSAPLASHTLPGPEELGRPLRPPSERTPDSVDSADSLAGEHTPRTEPAGPGVGGHRVPDEQPRVLATGSP